MIFQDFLQQALDLSLSSHWDLQDSNILVLKTYLTAKYPISDPLLDEMKDLEIHEEDQDVATLNYFHTKDHDTDRLLIECHVVYSDIWSCPVFYFNASHASATLSCQELFQLVHSPSDSIVISQTYHPVLNIPFYYLHPCQTSSVLKDWEQEKEPLRLWITMIERELPFIKLKNDVRDM